MKYTNVSHIIISSSVYEFQSKKYTAAVKMDQIRKLAICKLYDKESRLLRTSEFMIPPGIQAKSARKFASMTKDNYKREFA
jgi:hypothetical protein